MIDNVDFIHLDDIIEKNTLSFFKLVKLFIILVLWAILISLALTQDNMTNFRLQMEKYVKDLASQSEEDLAEVDTCQNLGDCDKNYQDECLGTAATQCYRQFPATDQCQLKGIIGSTKATLRLPKSKKNQGLTCQEVGFICKSKKTKSFLEGEINRQRKGRYTKAYVGSETGIFYVHPGTDVDCTTSYDPRIRPWYVSINGVTKNFIYVNVKSTSNIARVQSLTKYLINNVGPQSTVQLMIGSSSKITVENLCSQALTISKAVRQKLLTNAEQNISINQIYNVTAMIDCGNEFFGPIDKKYKNMLYYVTDETIDVDHFVKQKQKKPNFQDVAVNMVKVGNMTDAEKKNLEQLACSTEGIYVHDDGSMQQIPTLMQGLSQYLQHHMDLKRPVWSSIYQDAFGFGKMVTISMPVMINQTKKGVAGIDVTIATLKELTNWTQEWIQAYFHDIHFMDPNYKTLCEFCGGKIRCQKDQNASYISQIQLSFVQSVKIEHLCCDSSLTLAHIFIIAISSFLLLNGIIICLALYRNRTKKLMSQDKKRQVKKHEGSSGSIGGEKGIRWSSSSGSSIGIGDE